VQVRGDRRGAFDPVAQVVLACQRAGIARISFITEPQALR
jgi:biopolymer transport protein ExbD